MKCCVKVDQIGLCVVLLSHIQYTSYGLTKQVFYHQPLAKVYTIELFTVADTKCLFHQARLL